MFRIVTLGDGGENDIAGRAIVVHAGEDDLGKGGDAESKKTGNAGARKKYIFDNFDSPVKDVHYA